MRLVRYPAVLIVRVGEEHREGAQQSRTHQCKEQYGPKSPVSSPSLLRPNPLTTLTNGSTRILFGDTMGSSFFISRREEGLVDRRSIPVTRLLFLF